MQIIISGHGIDITPALKTFIQKKVKPIEKHYPHLAQKLETVLHVKKIDQIAEGTVHGPHVNIHARADHMDMYVAIEQMVKKLEVQLAKVKGKL